MARVSHFGRGAFAPEAEADNAGGAGSEPEGVPEHRTETERQMEGRGMKGDKI